MHQSAHPNPPPCLRRTTSPSYSPPFAHATARPRTRSHWHSSVSTSPSSTSGSSNVHGGDLTLARPLPCLVFLAPNGFSSSVGASFAHPGPRRLGEMGRLGGDDLGREAISPRLAISKGMTGFLIELRSSGYPEQLGSKLQYVAEGWCRVRETRTSRRRTPLRTRRRSAQLCCVVWGQSGWASGGTELPRHNLRDPTGHRRLKSSLDPVEAEELGADDFDVGSALHASLEDAAYRVQLPHIATAQLFHTHQPDSTSIIHSTSMGSANGRGGR
ncbi:hypothetical protein DFH08DRAFT_935866 [Mycena albidolilacea]|uniref:Uncharacterized protein n=1 Tax=Mycena albidolilacea TaxID=1033008 RepID=A0AAD7A3F7_9AGAR|nr:hypothetical protein DFH08DRAFT_935866 [Mycena albidolilacea]